MILRQLLCCGLLIVAAQSLHAEPDNDSEACSAGFRHINDEGYREDYYMARTPDCVPGGVRLDTGGLRELISNRPEAVLIDVMAVQDHILPDLERGWIQGEERVSIRDSLWLPNVGLGWIDDEIRQWFAERLRAYSGGDSAHPLVFYCLQDCWMAWNAARRAARMGYTAVYWYADGIDVWAEKGLPTERAEPVPLRGNLDDK
ncbi:rhodanese-like domain-containing protein [Methylonatrum kenyense]|uniref:rhodanese-like domain-containing protein n=1 Tax=Methylonatrum kenyense TaxID=455253 RepID=UPI0020BF4A38|nr:rhodanese-like domain-containing protein [Methylonatrum kenyense]MCK8516040.1 rhodanese-like domain-containing protein [Methylonatrum kenyense]